MQSALSAAEAALDRTLGALADPHRRRAIALLGRGPTSAGDLAKALSLSPPAMSRHLRTLRQTGLVAEEPDPFDARVRVYRLRPEPMEDLRHWLEATESMWREQLLAFRDHLERSVAP